MYDFSGYIAYLEYEEGCTVDVKALQSIALSMKNQGMELFCKPQPLEGSKGVADVGKVLLSHKQILRVQKTIQQSVLFKVHL